MPAYFEVFHDKLSRYLWRLKNEDASILTTLTTSVRRYRTSAEAFAEIALLRRIASSASVEFFPDSKGKDRWRLRRSGGVIIASAVRGYNTKVEAKRESELVRRLAPTALLRDLTALYPLGFLPAELEIRWPAPPVTSREVIIKAPVTTELRCEEPNTRYVVRANIARLTVAASDLDVQVESGVEIGSVFIQKSMARLRFRGGRYGKIEAQKPADFNVTPVDWREEWLATDILFDGIDVDSARSAGEGYAFDLRGKRLAILRSRVRAERYCVWVGDTATFRSEDIILAGNTFDSAGPEATVRLQPAFRSVVVDNRMTNPQKHNYRVHGRSDLAFAARNTLIHAGVKLAREAGDQLGTVWLQGNVFHHTLPSLLDLDQPRGAEIRRLIATGNTIYSDVWRQFFEGTPPAGWIVDGTNRFLPYRPFES